MPWAQIDIRVLGRCRGTDQIIVNFQPSTLENPIFRGNTHGAARPGSVTGRPDSRLAKPARKHTPISIYMAVMAAISFAVPSGRPQSFEPRPSAKLRLLCCCTSAGHSSDQAHLPLTPITTHRFSGELGQCSMRLPSTSVAMPDTDVELFARDSRPACTPLRAGCTFGKLRPRCESARARKCG